MQQRQITPTPPTVPQVRCPGCFNFMGIKLIETLPKESIELTYRCDLCDFDTKRVCKAKAK